jgi:hypothetical protein
LAHHRVLQHLNAVYADSHCWMTYGPVCVLASACPGVLQTSTSPDYRYAYLSGV